MFSRPASRRARSRTRYSSVEALEDRALLAGDLSAIVAQGDLIIDGDRGANQFEVTVLDGDIVVRGLDGTTVNGEAEFVAFADSTEIPDDLILRTGEGSDEVVLSGGLIVGDTIDARLSAGANAFSVIDASAQNLIVRAAGANEILLEEGADISGDFVVRFSGNGADTIIVDGATIGDDLSVRAGNGHNVIMVDGVSIGDDAAYAGGRDQDDLMVTDSNVTDNLTIKTRSGDDFVQVDSSEISDRTRIALGAGDDNVQGVGSNSFGIVSAVGSSGSDSIELGDETDGVQRTAQFEGSTVDSDLADDRLDGDEGLNTRRKEVEDRLAELIQEGTLSLAIDPSTFSEGDGVVSGTVTRDTADVRDLVVTLTSSDSDNVSVSETVTILSGETSATFDVVPVDNQEPDGGLDITITASASRHIEAMADLTIEDDDILQLEVSQDSVNESDGPITATLTRLSSTADDLVVTVSSSDSDELSVPETVTIPAGESFVEFAVTPLSDNVGDGDQTATITVSQDNHSSASVDISVADDDFLTLTIDVLEFSEGAGAAAVGTIERASGSTEDLIVTLTSSDETAVTVPDTVTIPAGQSSVTFDLSAVDDLLDGDTTQISTITASADGLATAAVDVSVTDDDTLEFSLDSPEFSEGSTDTITALVTRGGDTSADQVIQLSSSLPGVIDLPSEVTIPAGQTSVSFEILPIDNNTPSGDQFTTVTAGAIGFGNVSEEITSIDDDILIVSIEDDLTEISENGGIAVGEVRRESATDFALEVTLANSDPSEISIPDSVTIPAGSDSVTFDIQAVDDSVPDGTQAVTIGASALNHTPGTVGLDVTDDVGLVLSFESGATSVGEEAGVEALVGTVTREGDLTDALTVTLESSDTSELTVDEVVIPAGQASTQFAITTIDDNDVDLTQQVVITATAEGAASGSIEIDVLDDDASIVVTAADSQLSEEGLSTTVTLTRNSDNTEELVVELATSADGLSGVPETATFLAGEDTLTFDVTTIDDTIVQGDRTVTITATTPLHSDGVIDIQIVDDEAQLTLTFADDLVAEGFGIGGTSLTVRRNTPLDEELSVTLISSNQSEISVPQTVVIPAGQEEVTVDIDVIDDTVEDGLQSSVVTASAAGHANGQGTIQVNDDDANTIRLFASDRAVDSGNSVVTRDADFVIEGLSEPGAVIQVDTNGDGAFDEDTVTANAAGFFSYTASLTTGGDNSVAFMTTDAQSNESEADLDVHLAEGTLIRFTSNVGVFDVELLDEDAPITVENFLGYLERFTDSIIHRAPANFVIQGGGFTVNDTDGVQSVETDAPIINEFDPANSNLRGTLSMALLGGQPNSGTSGWFVNTVDNSGLDGAFHTVFGRVITDGLATVDRIQNLEIADLTALNGSAFATTPLLEPFNEIIDLSGTVSGNAGEAVLTGQGTSFTTELQVGDVIRLDGSQFVTVGGISSDTELTLLSTLAVDLTDVGAEIQDDSPPAVQDYVVFSSIAEILDDV